MKKSVMNKQKALSIGSLATAILAHIAVILFVVLARGYFNLDVKIIACLLVVIVCVLIIIDILLFYGMKFKDIVSRTVIIVLSVLMMIVGFGGSYYVSKVNKAVDNAIENTGTDQYETINGSFVYYSKDGTEKYKDLDSLKSVSNLKVGVVFDDGIGVATAAQKLMEENGIDATVTTYSSSEELLGNLLGNGTDDIDVAVFPSSYRQRWLADEEVDYAQYLDHVYDFYKFEDKVKTGENKNANKTLYTEPFNILLIGFAPEDEAMTTGLADSIIVATVNPQTFTVSLTSIARDTYTKLACAPNSERQKINAARAYSRQCLMDTVGELLGIDIDYYMEINFLGVVEIVDAIGGIVVDNPVEFVGQTASGIRGEFTVLVPAGENVPCDGEMALAFARERHAMPNGDFDRQQHQQQVISRIAEKLLGMSDVNQALKVMEAAGNNFSTNLSLNQLTGIFNYIINHKNTVGIPTFNMIDIQNMRITGYSSWYYSYIMRLPQWIYRLYNGSIQEAKNCIDNVMNNYSISDIKQESYMKFFVEYPYSRGQLYSNYFNEEQVHEKMPASYPKFIGKDLATAMSLAQEQGISLNVNYIEPGSEGYDESLDGQVTDQYPRQGALVEEYPTGSITFMGSNDPNFVPEYTVENCNDEASCKAFAQSKGINVNTVPKYDANNEHNEGDITTNYKNGDKIKKDATLEIYKWTKICTIPAYQAGTTTLANYQAALDNIKLGYKVVETSNGATEANNGTVAGVDPAVGANAKAGDVVTVTVYKYVAATTTPSTTPSPSPSTTPSTSPSTTPSTEPTVTPTPETPSPNPETPSPEPSVSPSPETPAPVESPSPEPAQPADTPAPEPTTSEPSGTTE